MPINSSAPGWSGMIRESISVSPGRGSAIRSVILAAADSGAISEAERILHRHVHAAGIPAGAQTTRCGWGR
ncbi:MAG TPA: hypothetical protein VIU11_15500 [Nakamurella sp.]